MSRRGFTLIELLIAMAVMAILGTILTRVLVDDSRFVSRQDAMMSARQAARAALNTMLDELRMTSDGGVMAASPDSVRIRVPYGFGIACGPSGSDAIVSLIPADSLMYANAIPDGLARRDGSSIYTFLPGISVAPSGNMAQCNADSIRVIPGGRLVAVSGIAAMQQPVAGTLVYLYQTVTYRFGPSGDLPGRRGLWRRASGAPAEELVAPFDTTAGFACLVGPILQVENCPPVGGVTAIRGLELRLVGASEFTPRGASAPETFDLSMRVTFLNKVN